MISVFTSPDRLQQLYSPVTTGVANPNADSPKCPFLSFLFKHCHETYVQATDLVLRLVLWKSEGINREKC